MYDAVNQYGQVLSGRYDDWHPPVVARLWALLHPLGAGTAPMFVLQVGLYWLGFGLWGMALARNGRRAAGVAVLAVALFPLWLGWQAAVLKDAQMVGGLLAATGLIATWRLAGKPVPRWALGLAGVLLAYAMLARSNAVFAVVPLIVMLTPLRGARRLWAGLGGILIVLALSGPINHQVFGARTSAVTHSQPTYDLAGIAHFSGSAELGGLTARELDMIEARQCYTPFFWDPLASAGHCGPISDRLAKVPLRDLAGIWVRAVLHNPLAYARHRIGHLNSTWRFLVPPRWTNAAPPGGGEPNALGLTNPGPAGQALARLGAAMVELPFGWPVFWIVVAGMVLTAQRGDGGPAGELAAALAVSALTLEASFAVISIASDLRYHLWPMIAAALAVVAMGTQPWQRKRLASGGAVLIVVVLGGAITRTIMPLAPANYDEMLGGNWVAPGANSSIDGDIEQNLGG